MAISLAGTVITNRVKWTEDANSRKIAFSSLDTYRNKVMGIKTQLMGLGNIKIKVDGLDQVKAQLSQIKAEAAKTGVQIVESLPTSTRPPISTPRQTDVDKAHGSALAEDTRRRLKEEKRIADILRFEQTPAMQKMNALERESVILGLKKKKNANDTKVAMAKQLTILRAEEANRKLSLKTQNKQNFAQKRATGSMAQLAGGAFSVFTALQGIAAIAKTGMEMQKVAATMLSVSKDSNEAKENMTFLRKESHRLGMDRVKAGRALSKILAARGDLSLEESKKLFTSVSEAGVVSGTSADEMSLQVKALSQMLGKTTVMSEELKSQLGDTMPVALQIFAEAAKEAGISTSGTTKELFKLMEDGLLPAQKIMPLVAKGFSKFANKNDALRIALTKLNKRYDVAKDSLLDFNEAAFGSGVEDGLSFLLNGFSDLMKSSKAIAAFLGGTFKGAVVGITAPFRLVYAAVYDITQLISKDWLPSQDELSKSLLETTGKMLGLVGAVWALKKAWQTFKGVKNLLGGAKEVITGGKSGGVGGGGLLSGGVQKVFVTNMGGGLGSDLTSGGTGSTIKDLLKKFAAVAGFGIAGVAAAKSSDALNAELESRFGSFGSSLTKGILQLTPFRGYQPQQSQQTSQNVLVTVKHDTDMFTSEVENISDGRISQSYSEMF